MTTDPDEAPDEASEDQGPPTRGATGFAVSLLSGLVALAVAVVAVVALISWISSRGGDTGVAQTRGPSATERQGPQTEKPAPGVLTPEGLRALVAGVRSQTGGTEVFDATLYPAYAVVQLPVDAKSRRQSHYYWDGRTLSGHDSFGTADSDRFDLGKVGAETVLRLSRQARRLVDTPTIWYVVMRAPDEEGVAVLAYAANAYNEGAYVAARRDGSVVRKVTW